MFCEQCGQKITDGSLFCEYCGAKIEVQPQVQAQPQVEPQVQVQAQPQVEPQAQTQPQAQYAAYQPYNAVGAAAAPMTKSQIMIIVIVVEAIAIIAAIFGMKSFVGSKFSARAYAQKYFVSVANDDIKTAFELTDIKKSDLVNEDTFENYLAQQTDYGHAKSYKVTSDFQDDIYQIVNIDYESSISGNTSSCYVKMIGDSKKKMGIFDTWKVSMGDIFTNNYKIIVLKGAKVTFDGIELKDSYKSNDKDYDMNIYDVYVLPQIFTGQHQIDVTLEGYNPVSKTSETYSGDGQNVYVSDMVMTEEYVKSIENTVYQNLKTIYASALTGQSFESLPITFYSENMSDIKNEYEDLKEYLNQTDKMVDSIDFKNIQIASSTDSVHMRVSFDYDIKYICREGESKVESSSFSNYTEMVLQDGQWVQKDLCADSLMYLCSW